MTASPSTNVDLKTVDTKQLIELLRAWPIPADEKIPVELLIGFSGGTLIDNPMLRHYVTINPGNEAAPGPYAAVCWHKLQLALNLDTSAVSGLPKSERHILSIACSLAIGDLAGAATRLDQDNKVLLLRTIAVVLGVGGTAALVHRMYEAERSLKRINDLCDAADRATLSVDDIRQAIGGAAGPVAHNGTTVARTFTQRDKNDEPRRDPVKAFAGAVVNAVRSVSFTGMTEEDIRIAVTRAMNIEVVHPVVIQVALITAIQDGQIIQAADGRYYTPRYVPSALKEQP